MIQGTVAVVVVGDLARSPRMLNHARELAGTGRPVSLIGLREREFVEPAGVHVSPLRPWRGVGSRGIGGAAIRMTLTCFELWSALRRARPAAVLVQNPPAFPTLLAAWMAARSLRALLVIDWHNYGFSMLALKLGDNHRLTRLAERHERWMARRAARHFCVSEAMRADLAKRFGIRAEVLYDRPLTPPPPSRGEVSTPLIVVCPAGWTADEDIGMLLHALTLCDAHMLEVHITGDGPTRATLERRIADLREAGWTIHTGFLSEADYRALLARCHLGLSLHRSSSGLDLAMKVVDLFGAGVPVCAFDYGPCVREQVRDGDTGFLFRTASELAALLSNLQRDPSALDRMAQRVRQCWNITWTDEWRRVAQPILEGRA